MLRCKRVIGSPNSAYPRGKGINAGANSTYPRGKGTNAGANSTYPRGKGINAGANSAIPRGLGYAGIITHGLYRKKEQYDKHTPPFAINLQYTAPSSLPFL